MTQLPRCPSGSRTIHRALGWPHQLECQSSLGHLVGTMHRIKGGRVPLRREKIWVCSILPGQDCQPKTIPTTRENIENFEIGASRGQCSNKIRFRIGVLCPDGIGSHHKKQILLTPTLYQAWDRMTCTPYQEARDLLGENSLTKFKKKTQRKVKLYFPLKLSESSSKRKAWRKMGGAFKMRNLESHASVNTLVVLIHGKAWEPLREGLLWLLGSNTWVSKGIKEEEMLF